MLPYHEVDFAEVKNYIRKIVVSFEEHVACLLLLLALRDMLNASYSTRQTIENEVQYICIFRELIIILEILVLSLVLQAKDQVRE